MLPQPGVTGDLARLHQEWEDVHTRLRAQEQLLSEAIALYARGQGPRPETMMNEVEQMRAECSLRFKALMQALKAESATDAT